MDKDVKLMNYIIITELDIYSPPLHIPLTTKFKIQPTGKDFRNTRIELKHLNPKYKFKMSKEEMNHLVQFNRFYFEKVLQFYFRDDGVYILPDLSWITVDLDVLRDFVDQQDLKYSSLSVKLGISKFFVPQSLLSEIYEKYYFNYTTWLQKLEKFKKRLTELQDKEKDEFIELKKKVCEISQTFEGKIVQSKDSGCFYVVDHIHWLPFDKMNVFGSGPMVKCSFLDALTKKKHVQLNISPVEFEISEFLRSGKWIGVDKVTIDENRTGVRSVGVYLPLGMCMSTVLDSSIFLHISFVSLSYSLLIRIAQQNKALSDFQRTLDLPTFKNPLLLRIAMTDSSWTGEFSEYHFCNERLEFLGDAVLDLIVSREILQKNSHIKTPLDFIDVKKAIVSNENLNEIGVRMKLLDTFIYVGEVIRHGVVDHPSPFRRAQILESLIGAIFLDQGDSITEEFVKKYVLGTKNSELVHDSVFDSISNDLQPLFQKCLDLQEEKPYLKDSGTKFEISLFDIDPDHVSLSCLMGSLYLKFMIAEKLYLAYPQYDEGVLSRLRSQMIERSYLTKISVLLIDDFKVSFQTPISKEIDLLYALIGSFYLSNRYNSLKTRGYLDNFIKYLFLRGSKNGILPVDWKYDDIVVFFSDLSPHV